MKCYYEVLDVPRDADAAEIKTAYRKFALKWHPDKNLNNTEFAKEQFQLVQQAYEVLSDTQERAWYDKHREQILRGADSEFQDNSLDVFQYFTRSCFDGYNDGEKGFYTVYRNVFDKIIEEEIEFMEDDEEFSSIPRFGNSTSDYDEVVGPFYNYWLNYCTNKSYVWLDPHDIKQLRNRKEFKHFEKENKKVRTQAKKERNEEVRNLVAFVRKRDKRVQEHSKVVETKILENRRKQEELSKQKRLERKKQLNESGAQAEWTKFDNVKSELEQIEKNLAEEFGEDISNSEDDGDIEDIHDLYCVACNKIFKTPKALENHEASKKHKDNVEQLRQLMIEEDEELVENCVIRAEGGDSEVLDSDDSGELKKQKKKNKKSKVLTVDSDDQDTPEWVEITAVNDSDNNIDLDSSRKQKKKNKKQNKIKTVTESKVEESQTPPEKDRGNRKKQNRKDKKNGENENSDEIDVNHCCVTCKANFPSKNKLFDHLKKTQHGVYIPKKNGKIK